MQIQRKYISNGFPIAFTSFGEAAGQTIAFFRHAFLPGSALKEIIWEPSMRQQKWHSVSLRLRVGDSHVSWRLRSDDAQCDRELAVGAGSCGPAMPTEITSWQGGGEGEGREGGGEGEAICDKI